MGPVMVNQKKSSAYVSHDHLSNRRPQLWSPGRLRVLRAAQGHARRAGRASRSTFSNHWPCENKGGLFVICVGVYIFWVGFIRETKKTTRRLEMDAPRLAREHDRGACLEVHPPTRNVVFPLSFPLNPTKKGSMAACTMLLFTFNFLTLCLIAHKVGSPSHKPKPRPSTRGSNFMPRPEIHRTKGSDLSGSESRQTPSDRLRVGSRGPGRGHAVVLPRPSLGHARRRETPVAV